MAAHTETYLGDDTVEGRALEAEAVLASAELAEVARGLGHDVVAEAEDDAAGGLVVDGDVELRRKRVSGAVGTGIAGPGGPWRVGGSGETHEDVARHGDDGDRERRGWGRRSASGAVLKWTGTADQSTSAIKIKIGLSNRA